jgi:hypothetical protein
MNVHLDRAQRPQQQSPERDTRTGDYLGLETAMAPDPAQLGRVGSSLQRSSDGESRVYMSPRTPAHYQQTH